MTAFIIQTFVILLAIILFFLFVAWLGKFNGKDKESLIEKALDKVSSLVTSNVGLVMEQYKTGPWYLVVYTKETDYPLWISNNNIRSVHPDPQNRKLIIKQFNGEDMVIENVDNYELCPANEICDYDM